MISKLINQQEEEADEFNKLDLNYNFSEEEKSTYDSISLRSLSSTNSADGKTFRSPKMRPKKSLKLSTLMEEVSEMGSDVISQD